MHPSRILTALAAFASLAVCAAPLRAQRPWHGSAEASASLVTGNIEQRTLVSRGELSHADSLFELRASLSYVYSEASRDTLPRRMERRTWFGSLAFDYRSFGTVSPFAFFNYESSFEKRVLDRVGLGVGGKYTFVRNDATNASFSLALLEERLRPSRLSPNATTTTNARWSARFRVRHKFDSHLNLSTTTFYQPRLTRGSSYTINSMSDLNYLVGTATTLKVSYQSLYDSDARLRGARRNNDGQVLFGVKVSF